MREAAAGMEMCKFHAGGLFELLCALGICSWRVMRGGVGGGKGRGEVRPRLARPSVIIFFFSWQHYYLRWSPANTELEW